MILDAGGRWFFGPMDEDTADMNLVELVGGKPSCFKHGAMNKMSEGPPEGTGVWRCVTTNADKYQGQTGGCRAGCKEFER